jgi:hypothetical protein
MAAEGKRIAGKCVPQGKKKSYNNKKGMGKKVQRFRLVSRLFLFFSFAMGMGGF